jgi:hypothetical protein
VRCYVEPSPAGGYFVRLRGEAAPVSRHDTEEEAEAAAAAYERGQTREYVELDDGAEVLIRALGDEAVGAFAPATGERVGAASYVQDRERPHIAKATITVAGGWQARGLEDELFRRLSARAAEQRIRSLER